MKRGLLLSLGLVMGLSAGGCPPIGGRLNATPALIEACGGWATKDEIETMLSIVDAAMDEGNSKLEVMAAYIPGCGDDEACLTCMTDIVDQVYGD